VPILRLRHSNRAKNSPRYNHEPGHDGRNQSCLHVELSLFLSKTKIRIYLFRAENGLADTEPKLGLSGIARNLGGNMMNFKIILKGSKCTSPKRKRAAPMAPPV
tara:strand:+ start:6228 stop:6539 length:312 start_codon:yes stop_codon:yes gene_type:complete